jgi:hypothetical protein
MHPVVQTSITTGTVTPLFKPHALPSAKAAPYKFSYYSPKIFFFGKDFQKPDAQVAGLKSLSHF